MKSHISGHNEFTGYEWLKQIYYCRLWFGTIGTVHMEIPKVQTFNVNIH